MFNLWITKRSSPKNLNEIIDNNNQLISHLIGPAVYGKSRVIDALLGLTKDWNREGSIISTAFTGNAAQNAGGINIHALFGWSLFAWERRITGSSE